MLHTSLNYALTIAKVINDATSDRKPALGTTFTYLTDATIWLCPAKARVGVGDEEAMDIGEDNEKESLDGVYVAEVLRSRTEVSLLQSSELEVK